MQHDFILLDRSSSMHNLWEEALGSVNNYVANLARDNVDTGVTLAVFDGFNNGLDFIILRDRITPSTWRPIGKREAEPRGMTPLNDAIGRIVALANAGRYEKVAIIIMTDGQENNSKELSVFQAKTLLDSCQAKGWAVVFLGANYDNAAQVASYNVAPRFSASAAVGNMGSTMSMMSAKRSTYAQAGQNAAAMSFTEAEQTEAATPKAGNSNLDYASTARAPAGYAVHVNGASGGNGQVVHGMAPGAVSSAHSSHLATGAGHVNTFHNDPLGYMTTAMAGNDPPAPDPTPAAAPDPDPAAA